MPEAGDISESGLARLTPLDLRIENSGILLCPEIRVPGEFLGVSRWQEMLEKTQATRIEHGAVISWDGKRILTSRVFEGYGDRKNEDGQKVHASFIPPSFPHGIIKGLSPRVKDIVLVHAHFMSEKLDQLPTTALSATDISTYINHTYTGIVVIDRGGVHLLTGRPPYESGEIIDTEAIEKQAFAEANNGSKLIAEVRASIGKSLSRHGIRYYFSPSLTPSEDGPGKFINFKDVTEVS